MINTFQEEVQSNLLTKLNDLVSNNVNSEITKFFFSDDVEDIQVKLEQYLDEIRRHYDDFNMLLPQELDKPGTIRITYIVEQSLLKLLMLLERLIVNIESTNALLEEWKGRMVSTELQQVYN